MHKYYKKNEKKLLKDMRKMLSPLKREIEQATGEDADKIINEAQKVYKEKYLEQMPYIGGKGNSGTGNLTGSCYFVALYDVSRNYGATAEEIGKIATMAMQKMIERVPKFARALIKKIMYTNFGQKILKKQVAKRKAYAKDYPYSWDSEYREPNEKYTHQLIAHRCGIEMFLRDKDTADFLPYLCNLDYAMFGTLILPLARENAIGL
ncbi:MAG: L-2-amino-thiazoline-4-carboxylic acid hydrolase [Tissierellia bacterium]|nr:L-2-amino-thiazoline-4-carboxylic acid hydrolase [Tissierellia bacterium]